MFKSQHELTSYFINSLMDARKSGYTLTEDKKYHGDKCAVVRNGFAHSVSAVSWGGVYAPTR